MEWRCFYYLTNVVTTSGILTFYEWTVLRMYRGSDRRDLSFKWPWVPEELQE